MNTCKKYKNTEVQEIVMVALSDHISFDSIAIQFGVKEAAVKRIMREQLNRRSYLAWRRRVSGMSKRREFYKRN